LERDARVREVQVVDVDEVRVQTGERRVEALEDALPRLATWVGPRAGLRRENELVAPILERLADELLRRAAAVALGTVDEVDAESLRSIEDRLHARFVDDAAELIRAEPERGHLDTGAAERAIAHQRPSFAYTTKP